ncbi:hypothetical protein RB195_017554 [Necator americanus]|uniref:Uncharacterized protein n=1 Tax=Necator americanus TaxID=51031 RepID=A0ABR1C5R5_NECAM
MMVSACAAVTRAVSPAGARSRGSDARSCRCSSTASYLKLPFHCFRDMSSVSLQNLLSTTGTDDSDDRSMQDELLTTSRTITMCHFIVFNFCVGFFGYYIWLIFPRPRSNEATESERKSTDEIR